MELLLLYIAIFINCTTIILNNWLYSCVYSNNFVHFFVGVDQELYSRPGQFPVTRAASKCMVISNSYSRWYSTPMIAPWLALITMKIKTSGSESRGQEEAACMRVFRPTRPLQWVIYMDGSSKLKNAVTKRLEQISLRNYLVNTVYLSRIGKPKIV